ncbi:MAG: aldo/keto reductase [Fibrobacteres bacterium]|nr:aldo/keto reductase [Fibrobacterota bacterium]
MKKVKWGFIGCGAIAKAFAHGIAQTESCEIVAVSSPVDGEAAAFASEYKIAQSYTKSEDLLADKNVEVVYICTPHTHHARLSIAAAEAGKHILCEKPMALNHADAMTVLETVRRCGVFFVEGLMYRCHPQIEKILELVRTKAVGDIRMMSASFGFGGGNEYNAKGRLFRNELAGGGIMDVGGYPVSIARLIAGAQQGKPFAEPVTVTGAAQIGKETQIDEWASAEMKFADGLIAQLSTGIRVTLDNNVKLYGADGTITIVTPWAHDRVNPNICRIIVHKKGEEAKEITVPAAKTTFALEAELIAKSISRQQAPAPAMTWADSLGNMRALDMWREAVALTFADEAPAAYATPLNGRKLKTASDTIMKYSKLPGLDKKVSRLIMGVDNQNTIAHATAMFDDFIERGGNCFDTAWVYAAGKRETIFGQWLNNRKIREDIVLVAKGAHTPFCNPEAIHTQFEESMGRLQTNYADIYFMHRDNPKIPVGEFIDALNDLLNEGKIKMFGTSNWTLPRLKEANEWAAKHGKQGFTAVSNNFSLARMISPIWAGCISSAESEFYEWHKKTKTPVFAWSSQARGFFVAGLASPDKKDSAEMVNTWYSDDNFERQKRCFELAKQKNVQPINIALAYVLHQQFETFALIGPRFIDETRSSFEGLKVSLSEKEVKWLNLEAEKI